LQRLDGEKNTVCLISGRNSAWLEQWFGSINIYLIAEHGARFRLPGENWTSKVSSPNNWKGPVKQIMQEYVSKCAHSFIEEKDFSMVWHYRKANPGQAKLYAAEMTIELNDFIQGQSLNVFSGKKIVEVKNSQINKGAAIQRILLDGHYDFILAIGDDYTDEDMFKVLAGVRNSYTIKVGNEASYAAFNLYTPQMVISLLEIMSVIET
jgi:trehalose 6-phosphate synthase/phosphatase